VIHDRRLVQGNPLTDRPPIGRRQLAGDEVGLRTNADHCQIFGVHARAMGLHDFDRHVMLRPITRPTQITIGSPVLRG
jgi:hypothetical protein